MRKIKLNIKLLQLGLLNSKLIKSMKNFLNLLNKNLIMKQSFITRWIKS